MSAESLNQPHPPSAGNEEEWVSWGNLMINAPLFEKGIIAVKVKRRIPGLGQIVSGNQGSFTLGSKKYQLIKDKNPPFSKTWNSLQSSKKADKKTSASRALASLLPLSKKKPDEKETDENQSPTETFFLKSTISSVAGSSEQTNNNTSSHETFYPLMIENEESKVSKGIYIHPWLSNGDKDFGFKGFRFVSANCMGGSNLKAKCERNFTFSLIKHELPLYSGQKIVDVLFEEEFAAYEKMVSEQFEDYCKIINKFSPKGAKKSLVQHLPNYDYLLFGIELFHMGLMNFDALDEFNKLMYERKKAHEDKLQCVAKKYGIECTIVSPFKNLFGFLENERNPPDINTILDTLGLPNRETKNASLTEDQIKKRKKEFAAKIASKLKESAHDPLHQTVWQDLFKAFPVDEINDLEDLFRIGNAQVIASASKDLKDYELCSLLPATEKQIQVQYATFLKKFNNASSNAFDFTICETFPEDTKPVSYYLTKNYKESNGKWALICVDEKGGHENISISQVGGLSSFLKGSAGAGTAEIDALHKQKEQIKLKIKIFHDRQKSNKKAYPEICNLTTLDPVLSYTTASTASAPPGSLFYFNEDAGKMTLSNLIEAGIIEQSTQNIALTAQGKPPVPLRTFLKERSVNSQPYRTRTTLDIQQPLASTTADNYFNSSNTSHSYNVHPPSQLSAATVLRAGASTVTFSNASDKPETAPLEIITAANASSNSKLSNPGYGSAQEKATTSKLLLESGSFVGHTSPRPNSLNNQFQEKSLKSPETPLIPKSMSSATLVATNSRYTFYNSSNSSNSSSLPEDGAEEILKKGESTWKPGEVNLALWRRPIAEWQSTRNNPARERSKPNKMNIHSRTKSSPAGSLANSFNFLPSAAPSVPQAVTPPQEITPSNEKPLPRDNSPNGTI
jgi:hypothetical protein